MKRLLLTLIVVLLAGSPLLGESSAVKSAAGKKTRAFQVAKHSKHARKHHRKHRKRHRRTQIRRTAFNQAQSQPPAASAI